MNDHSGHENKHEYYTFPLGEIGANCYIVDCGGGTAAVIDPGDEAEVIVGELERLHLCPGAVLITHGHFDHVGAARELSARYGCSRNQLINVFRSNLHETPYRLLSGLRMRKARELLLSRDDLSIKEISVRAGYSNALNFSTEFKKRFKLAPGEYRRIEH